MSNLKTRKKKKKQKPNFFVPRLVQVWGKSKILSLSRSLSLSKLLLPHPHSHAIKPKVHK